MQKAHKIVDQVKNRTYITDEMSSIAGKLLLDVGTHPSFKHKNGYIYKVPHPEIADD